MGKKLVELPKFEDLKIGDELHPKSHLVHHREYGDGVDTMRLYWWEDMYCESGTVSKIDSATNTFQILENSDSNIWYNLDMFSHKIVINSGDWIVGVCNFDGGCLEVWNKQFETHEEAVDEIKCDCFDSEKEYEIVDENTIVTESCMYIVCKEQELKILNSFIERYLQIVKSDV